MPAPKKSSNKRLILILLCLSQTAIAREVVDASGTAVKLGDRPARIVTLAPSLGEIAAELSEGELKRIVGVSEFTDYPPALSSARSIGPYARVNLEAVASLKPDLILATWDGNSRDQVQHLRELGFPVLVVKTGNLGEIEESLRLISKAMAADTIGERMVLKFKKGIEQIELRSRERKKSGKPAPRALVQLDSDPLIVAGKSAFLNELLSKLGAVNVYADAGSAYPRPSLEDAIRRDPDVVLILGMGQNLAPFEKSAEAWKRFSKLKAVKNKKIRVVPGDTVLRPTLRILDGMNLLEKAIHGESS